MEEEDEIDFGIVIILEIEEMEFTALHNREKSVHCLSPRSEFFTDIPTLLSRYLLRDNFSVHFTFLYLMKCVCEATRKIKWKRMINQK